MLGDADGDILLRGLAYTPATVFDHLAARAPAVLVNSGCALVESVT